MKKPVSGILFVLLLVSVFAGAFNVQSAKANASSRRETVQAADPVDWWPMFHHDPNHTGTSTSPAPTTNSTLWTYHTGFLVESSPAVAGGFVYVGSADDKVYCLNAASGAFVWSYQTGSWVVSSPAVVGGLVYVGSWDGNVYCLNAGNGALIWSYLSGIVESSPAVVGGLVFVGSDDYHVYCLNAGVRVWSYTTGGVVYSSPAVVGGLVYVGSNDRNVYCLNAVTGTKVWSYTTGNSVESSPAVVGGFVYVGSDDGNVYCLNAGNGALIWSYQTGNEVFSSPAVAGGFVYVGSADDKVYCLNATSGAFVWSYKTGGYVDYSSPAVVGGLVYVGSSDFKVYCLNATNGALVWRYKTGSWVDSSPAVVNGVVYIGSETSQIYAFGLPPLTVSISPTSVTTDVGQSYLFTSTVSHGTSSYSYQWYLNGAAVSGATDATWAFAPASVGSYMVYLNVTDSLGVIAISNAATVTVNAVPSVTIMPGSWTLDVDQSFLFTSIVSGGTSPYLIQWYLNGVLDSDATNSTSYVFTFNATGAATVNVTVTDSVGVVAISNTATVTVNALPSIAISPNSATLDVNQSLQFTSNASYGTSPYQFQWYQDGVPIGGNSTSWTFSSSSPGSYMVYLNVTDSVGVVAMSNIVVVTVNAVPSVTISPSSATLYVGQSQQFISTVSNGTSPYAYQWCLNGNPVSGATNATWTFTPGSSGSYTVYVNVTDNVGFRAKSNNASVTVAVPIKSLGGLVGITGYKLIFGENLNNTSGSLVSNVGYWWNYTASDGTSGTTAENYTTVALGNSSVMSLSIVLKTKPALNTAITVAWTFYLNITGTIYTVSYGPTTLNVHPGDINGVFPVTFPYFGANGHINLSDLGLITGNWQKTVPQGTDPTSNLARADINGDGHVNLKDLGVITGNWQKSWP